MPQDFSELIYLIEKTKDEDYLKAIALIEEGFKNFFTKEEHDVLNSYRDFILVKIKLNNLQTKTNLPTLDLINIIKSKKMDHLFFVCYNILKTREDVKDYASEFQFFFNYKNFDESMFSPLIYDLLVEHQIDYDYKVEQKIINPKKLGSVLKNKDIAKLEEELKEEYGKDIAKFKVVNHLFSIYIFKNWSKILFNETKNDYITIKNVAEVLLGNKDKSSLTTDEEKEFYKMFL
ncbi:hypothetical protein PUW93_01980 [Metamycoplasma hyosynoviae]|uniref:hypothetical protein n=2 Tax=Metamycoplasma hyosynoviae TaxID=29559 RepID=UPI0023596BE3|nr:hypothetical protein [Metamycoplasma hyosynoviae]MDC8917846.1 hypothetical protein [Metamycoplasma hyosynoviae]MDC8918649.1 hypothetical protein [Metamycoplasma hyosynoviae]MDD7895092.1 hypothetical protein [Metamycoplasma hyosynoviae]MDD7908041.1 hypothetical protein [Metamycoplasma hyosynoviae]